MKRDMMENLMAIAIKEAKISYKDGGICVGAVISNENGDIIAKGHNQHYQDGNPTSHGETQCVKNAGRRRDWKELTLFTTLSPCSMCTGMAELLKFKRVVIGDRSSFHGPCKRLKNVGTEVIFLDDQVCIDLMSKLLKERPDLFAETIGN